MLLETQLSSSDFGLCTHPSEPIALTVFTRYEHGNLPVRVFQNPETLQTNYEVSYPSTRKVFFSARKMISEFYGHDVHMPFDRYFRLGRYRPQAAPGPNLLQLLDKNYPTQPPITVNTSSKTSFRVLQSTGIAISGAVPTPKNSSKVQDDTFDEFFESFKKELGLGHESGGLGEGDLSHVGLGEGGNSLWTPEMDYAFAKSLGLEFDRIDDLVGINLQARAHEVRKLLFAGFAGRMLSRGYDPEDVLQEVYRGLLVRNRGTCPWDRRKSSFGHYVHMCISGILINYHRKESKVAIRDAVPLEIMTPEGELVPSHAALSELAGKIHHGSEVGDMSALRDLENYLMGLPDTSPEALCGRVILPWVTAGCTRREIVQETSYKEGLVSRALTWLRHQTALWATEMGLGIQVPLKWRMG